MNAVEHEKVGPGAREVAGSFVSLALNQTGMEAEGKVAVQTSMRVVLDELLEDLSVEGQDRRPEIENSVHGRVR
jgi:polyphenol oxidase